MPCTPSLRSPSAEALRDRSVSHVPRVCGDGECVRLEKRLCGGKSLIFLFVKKTKRFVGLCFLGKTDELREVFLRWLVGLFWAPVCLVIVLF